MANTPTADSLEPMAMTDQEREDLFNETTYNIGVFHTENMSVLQATQARNAALRAQLLENDAEIAAAQAKLVANATGQAALMADLAAKLGKNPAPSPSPVPPHVPVKSAPAPHATVAELHAIKQEQRSMDLARQQREQLQQQQREQAQLEHALCGLDDPVEAWAD
ncbi:unnamed protein product [Scytosiphon promiscuus]